MRVAVTRYGPPTRMLGMLYVPPVLETARYCVPLGTCSATTFASARGDPVWSATKPLIAAVVTPWLDRGAGVPTRVHSSKLASFTQSSLGAGDGTAATTS